MRKIKIPLLLVTLFFSICSFSFSQEYALILSGGGGKGAYEVGVWKALTEYGFAQKVTVISGTSVGGLNAALFSCEPVDRVIGFWKQFVPAELWNNTEELIDQRGLLRIINKVDLEKLQDENFYPKIFITTSRARFWVGKLVLSKMGFDFAHRFLLNEETDVREMKKILLATSAFPVVTSSIKLKDGYNHVDGGVSDNIPLACVQDYYGRNYFTQYFVVYLKNNPKRLSKKFPGENVLDIIPSQDMGGFKSVVDFSSKSIEDLIQLGYDDTVKILKQSDFYPVSDYWFN